MNTWVQTDENAQYEIFLGPGEYSICGPQQRDHETINIPVVNPPAEITHDIHEDAPPKVGPFACQVVDAANRPVVGAIVDGTYPSSVARRLFTEQTTNDKGEFQTERTHTPLYLHARSADGKLAGVVRIDEKAVEGRIVVGPVATATGRLLDLDGKVLAQKRLPYGIRIHINEDDDWPFHDDFGGTAQTDAEGRFTIPGLVPGQTYHVAMELTEKSWTGVSILTPRDKGPLDLGELRIDTVLNRPYVTSNPRETRAADAFSASTTASIPASLQKDRTMWEAHRAHTAAPVVRQASGRRLHRPLPRVQRGGHQERDPAASCSIHPRLGSCAGSSSWPALIQECLAHNS